MGTIASNLLKAPTNGHIELTALLRRAESGDASTLPVLRQVLQADGALVEFAGNLAERHRRAVIESTAGNDLVCKEAIPRKLEQLRNDLAGKDLPPLERLLVERIVSCWLSLHEAELRFTQDPDLSVHQAVYWQERIDRAQRRYLAAIKTLAVIRKLAPPMLQVNIGQEQLNIAGRLTGPHSEPQASSVRS
jgi:hypothetical protein